MPAIGAMLMSAFHIRRAPIRKVGGHLQSMFLDLISLHVMQMAVVKIIDVTIMTDSYVAAVRSMFVNMRPVSFRIWHG